MEVTPECKEMERRNLTMNDYWIWVIHVYNKPKKKNI